MKEKNEFLMYKYSLIIFDEEFDETSHTETGIVCATTFADAMAKLVSYYGDEAIVEVQCLVPWDANDVITKSQIKDMEL